MTAPLTDKQLSEIEAGLEGVTPGPWRWEYDALRQDRPDGRYGAAVLTAEMMFDSPCVDVSEADEAHIARLNPETVAAWLARDKAQRAEIEQLMRRNNMAMECIDEMLKDALADKIGDMKLTVSPDLYWRDKEEK